MNERENNLMLKLENGEKSPFFIHSFIQSFKGVALTTHKEKPLITLTIPVKLILKAFEYTVALLGGAFISAMIVWVVTSNQGLTTCTFWGGSPVSCGSERPLSCSNHASKPQWRRTQLHPS